MTHRLRFSLFAEIYISLFFLRSRDTMASGLVLNGTIRQEDVTMAPLMATSISKRGEGCIKNEHLVRE